MIRESAPGSRYVSGPGVLASGLFSPRPISGMFSVTARAGNATSAPDYVEG